MMKRLAGCLVAAALWVPAAQAESLFSHEGFSEVLKTYVAEGLVDYKGLQAGREGLDRYVASLGEVSQAEVESWNEQDQIAFWVNAYNAVTLKVIIDHYPFKKKHIPIGLPFPLNSIHQIPGKWKGITHTVAGEPRTLDAIEHKILRKQFQEPRIHVALVCAAMGCPPLRSEAYAGSRLEAQLKDQTLKFLGNPVKFELNREEKTVKLSPIFKWFGKDFLKAYGKLEGFGKRSKTKKAVLAFVARHLEAEQRQFLETGEYRMKYLGYDWSLNEQGQEAD